MFILRNLPTGKKKEKCESSRILPNNYAKQIKLSPTSGALLLSVSVNVDSTGPAEPENTREMEMGRGV